MMTVQRSKSIHKNNTPLLIQAGVNNGDKYNQGDIPNLRKRKTFLGLCKKEYKRIVYVKSLFLIMR